jgi:hypothetical protein
VAKEQKLLDGDFHNGDPMTLKLVEARPQVFRTPSIAGCPIIARDLLPEANIHAYTPSEASMPSQASNIIGVG